MAEQGGGGQSARPVNHSPRSGPSTHVAGHKERVIGSSTAGLEGIYREHGDRLWRALLGFTGDPEVASDAMAEAFVQALGRLDEIRTPLPWVWRAAFRIAAGEMKRQKGKAPLVEQSYEMPEPAAGLIEALRVLSAKQRGAIILHYYAGYSVRETATILGSTSSAVKVHLYRARRRLRQMVEGIDG
jgi:RNA polymerase sigma factor (sigma-70 family)